MDGAFESHEGLNKYEYEIYGMEGEKMFHMVSAPMKNNEYSNIRDKEKGFN